MKLKDKRDVLAYLTGHNDGTEEANRVIRIMTNECNWADNALGTVEIDDLLNLDEEIADLLREKLGKGNDEKWTVEDCQAVADVIYEEEGTYEFSDWLYNAIEQM